MLLKEWLVEYAEQILKNELILHAIHIQFILSKKRIVGAYHFNTNKKLFQTVAKMDPSSLISFAFFLFTLQIT